MLFAGLFPLKKTLMLRKIFNHIVTNERLIVLVLVFLVAIGYAALLVTATLYLPIHFDEYAHLNHLYNLTKGYKVHADFWCIYPASGYELFKILIRPSLYDSFSIISLRFVCIAVSLFILLSYGLLFFKAKECAVIGFLLAATCIADQGVLWSVVQFKPDSISNALAVIALAFAFWGLGYFSLFFVGFFSLSSILIMPKCVYTLTMMNGFLAAYLLIKRDTLRLIAISAGYLASTFFVSLFCLSAGTTIVQDIISSHLLVYKMAKSSQVAIEALHLGGLTTFIDSVLCPFLCRNMLLCFTLIAGLVSCLFRFKKIPMERRVLCVGIVLGSFFYLFQVKAPYDQYLAPFLLPLIFVVMFGFTVFCEKYQKMIVFILCSLTLVSIFTGIQKLVCHSRPQLVNEVSQINTLQGVLKASDVVLSAPVFPPFAQSLMYITCDQVGQGFSPFINDEAIKYQFTAEALEKKLLLHKPCIITEGINFPSAWYPTITNYLDAHQSEYQSIAICGRRCFVLKERLNF